MINCGLDWKSKSKRYEIKGLANNSSSPTDTWFVTYLDSSGKKVCESFLKIWVATSDILETIGLNYEAKVYQQIQNDFKPDTDPYFVELIDFVENVDYNTMLKFLKAGMPSGTNVESNFNRNIYYMLKEEPGRPAIDKNTKFSYDKIDKKNIKFNYIQTIVYENTLEKILLSNKYDVNTKLKIFDNLLKGIVALNKKKIYHQDLHFRNAFVTSDNDVRIYDYDRAYSEKIGDNKLIDAYYCKDYGSCNEKNDVVDLVKVFCNLYSVASLLTMDEMIEILFNNPTDKEIKDIEKKFKNDPHLQLCFFSKDSLNGSIFPLNSSSVMIENFHKIQTKHKIIECTDKIKKKYSKARKPKKVSKK